MKMLRWKYSIAVTLFEMLLVLFVSSLVAVSTFQYQQQQSKTAVADPLAERMYLYAQTVRQFVVDNQANIAAGTLNPFTSATPIPDGSTFTSSGSGANTIYTITGIAWLQALNPPGSKTPYLPPTFTFAGLNPLQLQRGSLIGNEAIQVQISTTSVVILYGALYDLAAGGKLEGSVTAMAATKANKLYDPLLGVSSFHYVGGVDKSGNVLPITATWDKTQTQQTYINSPDVTGDLNLSGSINLIPSAPAGEPSAPAVAPDITGVGKLAFDTNGAGTIDGLSTVNFSAPNGNNNGSGTGGTGGAGGAGGAQSGSSPYYGGAITNIYNIDMTSRGSINGIDTLNFTPGPPDTGLASINGIQAITFDSINNAVISFPGSNATINGLTTLNFATGGTITGIQNITFNSGSSITGLDSMTFSSGQVFSGLKNFFMYSYTNNRSSNYNTTVSYNGANISSNSWYCALSRVDNQNKASEMICNMYINGSNNYIINMGAGMVCSAQCFQYGS